MARGKAAFVPALQALQSFGGRPATCAEISTKSGVPEDSVNGAFLHHLATSRERDTDPLVERMQSKVYRPVTIKAPPRARSAAQVKAQDDLFEALGTTADGTIIVRGVNTQTMYRLGAL